MGVKLTTVNSSDEERLKLNKLEQALCNTCNTLITDENARMDELLTVLMNVISTCLVKMAPEKEDYMGVVDDVSEYLKNNYSEGYMTYMSGFTTDELN